MRRLLAGLAAMAFAFPWTPASAADPLKDDAIARLTASHDPAIPIAIGRVYVKQAGLKAAREVLAERGRAAGLGPRWTPQAPEWQAAEAQLAVAVDDVIARRLDDPAWFRAAWGAEAAKVLNAEEADEIATHFATEGGSKQRAVIELLLVGETLIANYTFTDRIHYGVNGSEREMEMLQKTWWVTDNQKIYDFTPYPNAIRFASQDPGVKYCKMLAIQGIDAINRHLDAVAREAVQAVRANQSIVDPQIERFRARA